MPDYIELPGGRRFRWRSQRRFALIGLDNNKPVVIKRSDKGKVVDKLYDDGYGAWVIDIQATPPVVRARTVTPAAAATLPARGPRRERRIPTPGAPCECGCLGATGGGRYLPGHDAKHKAQLITAALDGDADAIQTLEDKGWTKFLDKRREIKARPPKKRIPRTPGQPRQFSDSTNPHWDDDTDLDEVWLKLRSATWIGVQRGIHGILVTDEVRIGIDRGRGVFENSVARIYPDCKREDGPPVFDCYQYLYSKKEKRWETGPQRTFRVRDVVMVR